MRTKHAASLFAIVIALTSTLAQAQLSRTAVSVSGSDSNACTTIAPCRSITAALAQTNPGGEVIVLDSAGYGPFTVTKSVSVEAAPGVYAGVTSSGDGVTVSAMGSDTVVLRGLAVNGLGSGNNGISFTEGARLYVDGCLIQNFGAYGIMAWRNVMITDTTIRNCSFGIWVDNAGGPVKATIDHVFVSGASGTGVVAYRNANVTVSNTLATYNGTGFAATSGGQLNMETCVSSNNANGVLSNGAGSIVRIANTTATGNSNAGWWVNGGAIESWGNNRTRGNADPQVVGMPTSIVLY